MDGKFAVATKFSELRHKKESKTWLQQVNATRTASDTSFNTGEIVFQWNHSSNTWWSPEKSFLKVRVKLYQQDGTTALTEAKNIAPAMDIAASCLFKSCSLDINGKNIDRVPDYLAQVKILQDRMNRSRTFFQTIGEVNFMEASQSSRKASMTSDGGGRAVAEFEIMMRPPLAIFQVDDQLIPQGAEFTLTFNPHTDADMGARAVETTGIATMAEGTDFDFQISGAPYFYAHFSHGPRITDREIYLDLPTTRCQARAQTGDGKTYSSHNFTVKPSTRKIVVATQSTKIESDTRYIPTKFTEENGSELAITHLSVDYAGQSLLAPQLLGGISGAVDKLTESYMRSVLSADPLSGSMYSETYSQWKTRGPYIVMDVAKDAKDRSTQAVVGITYSTDATNSRILLFDIYDRSAKLTYKAGKVVNVEDSDV